MTPREKLAARVRALARMTVENGCSENEALVAAQKLAEMLAEHNMTVDEAELRGSPFQRHRERPQDAVGARLWKVAVAVAQLTGTTTWTGKAGAPEEVNFFGFQHEVEIAAYMLAICARAMRGEAAKVEQRWALMPAKKRLKVAAFLDGMADRLYRRILELVPPKQTGTGLVVLRDALMTAALKDIGIVLADKRARVSMDADEEYTRGQMAADRVALNKGLTGSNEERKSLR